MNAFFVVTASLFFLWIIRSAFFWLSIWQNNVYRPDRFFDYLFHKKHRFALFFPPLLIIKWLLFFSYAFTIFYDSFTTSYHMLIALFYFLQFLLFLKELTTRKFKRPALTVKNVVIAALTFAVCFTIFAFPLVDAFFWLLLIDFLTPLFVSFFVFVLLFPIELYADWECDRAAKIIRKYPELVVVAVTGSVGKSSVKRAIAHILGNAFQVVVTEGKDGTVEEAARTIVRSVRDDTQFLIVEMNAYARREVALLCRIVRPKIGVVVPISGKYLSLFKSMKNIESANYELVESLPKDGLCLFNVNNMHSFRLYRRSRKQKVFFARQKPYRPLRGKGMVAQNFVPKGKRVWFSVQVNGKDIRLSASADVHVENVLPGIFIAMKFGMKERVIRQALMKLK